MENLYKLVTKILSFIGIIAVLYNIIPTALLQLLKRWWSYAEQQYFNSYSYVDIPKFNESSGGDNVVYQNVQYYLASLDAISSPRELTIFRDKDVKNYKFSPTSDGPFQDSFRGTKVWWFHRDETVVKDNMLSDKCWFTLKIKKVNENLVLDYFDHIAGVAAEFKRLNRSRTLYTNKGFNEWSGVPFNHPSIFDSLTLDPMTKDKITLYTNKGFNEWSGVPFNHPSTFDSLGLDPMTKDKIIRDLDRFMQSKEFYRSVGRPWKRGYLLYGPSGTGKSSLVGAIANYMKYDVYDLELTNIFSNSELRSLFNETTNKSVIVIEDIDCSIYLKNSLLSENENPNPNQGNQNENPNQETENENPNPNQGSQNENPNQGTENQITLSGILNFADGLLSCCGEERIMIITTNYKDKLDPALLRSGRMDMHILLSYCTFPMFKTLASNYLQIDDDPLFSKVEETMRECGARITPAEITEILFTYVDDPVQALDAVISALRNKSENTQLCSSIATSESGFYCNDNGGQYSIAQVGGDSSSECHDKFG